MYFQHFGLQQAPFRITPDTRLFFPGGNRGAVLEALIYAIANGEGIVKVVGEVGSGKTMLCRMLEQELPEACEIVYLANPGLSREDILHAIAFELGLPAGPDDNRLQVMHGLQQYLLGKHAANRRVVVFVEEAQGMPLDTLEEIRLLSNLETSQDKLLQIVLFGQPELDEMLTAHGIRQLRERITYSFDLQPFERDQVRDYVNSRLRASGHRAGELFDRGAIAELTRYSHGLLRRINILADKALLAAYADNSRSVKGLHVRRAARDSEFTPPSRRPGPWLLAAAAVLLLAAGAALAWFLVATPAAPSVAAGDAPPAARGAPPPSAEPPRTAPEAGPEPGPAAMPAPAVAARPGPAAAPAGTGPRELPAGLVRLQSLAPLVDDPDPPADLAAIADRMRAATP